MSAKRLLLLGITGVNRAEILQRFSNYIASHYSRSCTTVDFDREYISRHVPITSYLDWNLRRQRSTWNQAWQEFVSSASSTHDDIILGLHGCYIRGHYGCRIGIDIPSVANFEPDLVVTLIGDVYDSWWRTESRASNEAWKGRPTLEQLTLGRRFEVAIGDEIAAKADCRHLVMAVSHPVDTLARCLYRQVKVGYLSFPISEPRRMLEKGDDSGINEVNQFIRSAHEAQKNSASLAFICPLAIDELPLRKVAQATDEEVEAVEFDREQHRWNMEAFWPREDWLSSPPPTGKSFPIDQVKEVSGALLSDVGWRDYRLAEQADFLIVYNPVFNNGNRISRGVRNEISFATRHDLPVYIYQEDSHDEAQYLGNWLQENGAGTMGGNPSSTRIIRKHSFSDLFSAAE